MSFGDGGVVYMNGQEVGRFNMPATAVKWSTKASSTFSKLVDVTRNAEFTVPDSMVLNGANTLSVEVRRHCNGGACCTGLCC